MGMTGQHVGGSVGEKIRGILFFNGVFTLLQLKWVISCLVQCVNSRTLSSWEQ